MNWIRITPDRQPPEGIFVLTKIDDQNGSRNIQKLKRQNNLYFGDDGLYVYYTPTHYTHM
jgi:predicted homoserine dehydrogenase-like protein